MEDKPPPPYQQMSDPPPTVVVVQGQQQYGNAVRSKYPLIPSTYFRTLASHALGISSANIKCQHCNMDVVSMVDSSIKVMGWVFCLFCGLFPGLLAFCMNGFRYEICYGMMQFTKNMSL